VCRSLSKEWQRFVAAGISDAIFAFIRLWEEGGVEDVSEVSAAPYVGVRD
jgi:hypothetical protein